MVDIESDSPRASEPACLTIKLTCWRHYRTELGATLLATLSEMATNRQSGGHPSSRAEDSQQTNTFKPNLPLVGKGASRRPLPLMSG
jgi:hypothetical protein